MVSSDEKPFVRLDGERDPCKVLELDFSGFATSQVLRRNDVHGYHYESEPRNAGMYILCCFSVMVLSP